MMRVGSSRVRQSMSGERDPDRHQRDAGRAAASERRRRRRRAPPMTADAIAAIQVRPGPGGDVGVGLLVARPARPVRVGSGRRSGAAPGSRAAPHASAASTTRDPVDAHEPLRAASARSPAARIASSGAGSPVNSSNCTAAWCTSRSSPPTSTRPSADARRRAASATGGRGPRRRRVRRRTRATRSAVLCVGGDRGGDQVDLETAVTSSSRRTVTSGRAGMGPHGLDRLGGPLGRADHDLEAAHAQVDEREPDRGRGGSPADDRGGRERRATCARGSPRSRPGCRCCRRLSRPSLEHERVGRTGEPGALGELVDERHRLALERHGQRQPAPVVVQARQDDSAGRPPGDPVGGVLPVQAERGVARPVQHRREGVLDRVTEHAAPTACRHQQASDGGAVLRRTRPCSPGTRRRSRRTWSRRSPGRR